MKRSDFEKSKIKHQLRDKQQKGIEKVIWSLSKEQKEYLESFYYIEPYLYEVTTRQFKDIKSKEPILHEIHYKNKAGKRKLTFKLTQKQIKSLEEYDICFRVLKYVIYLQRSF